MAALPLLCVFLAIAYSHASQIAPIPTPEQLGWMDLEVGVMLGFNLQSNCIFGPGASSQRCQDTASGFVPTPSTVAQWNPSQINVSQWMDVTRSFGAKYIVLVADHMTGFTLWDTMVHNFSIAHTAYKNGGQDVVKDFLIACQQTGIKPGFFYSTHYNWYLGVNDFKVGWQPLGGVSYTQDEYNAITAVQLKELLDMSDDWIEIWFDGGVETGINPSIAPVVQQLGRKAMCHSCVNFTQDENDPSLGYGVRWMGNEDGVMPLPSWAGSDGSTTGSPTAPYFMPPSSDTVLRQHYWFWKNNTANTLRSVQQLVQVYLTSVGRASNLILNVGPNSTGAVPEVDVQRYKEFGDALTCLFSRRLFNSSNLIRDGNNITVSFSELVQARNLSLWVMEDQTNGQLVNAWSLWLQFANGTWYKAHTDVGIGHKRILNVVLAQGKQPLSGLLGDGAIVVVEDSSALVGARLVIESEFQSARTGAQAALRNIQLYQWDGIPC
eukprot:TRINITY_DN11927_c0_g8_i1.p1 TRINITY_DN11927_c0_g8~~TRINITY_DN11927_c0_g8_i1.p1  ORF type:complete len:500 (+),score=78.50 TRINITY_DN11927_c0_g8_i1:22-1500(+)